MKQRISGFHLDGEGWWVADLECGHKQHVRHDPPWQDRAWTQTEEGRRSRLGSELDCKRCDELGFAVGEAIRAACLAAAAEAHEDAGIRGLCEDGRLEAARAAIQALDLAPIVERAIRKTE